MRSRTVRRGRGFSLIELLIVMVIIAILVLVAIPAISNYRSNARISAVQSDLRNTASVLESRYITDGAYPAASSTKLTYAAPGFTRVSDGVELVVAVSSGDRVCVNGSHAAVPGNSDSFYYASYDDSSAGIERGVHAGTCSTGTGSYPVDAPTAGGAGTLTGSSVSLPFSPVSGATSYRGTCSAPGSTVTGTAGASASSVTVANLAPGTQYSCTVAAGSGSTFSAESSPVTVNTPATVVTSSSTATAYTSQTYNSLTSVGSAVYGVKASSREIYSVSATPTLLPYTYSGSTPICNFDAIAASGTTIYALSSSGCEYNQVLRIENGVATSIYTHARYNSLYGLAVGPGGNVYTISAQQQLCKIAPTGGGTCSALSPAPTTYGAQMSFDFDAAGNLYVADAARIIRYPYNGTAFTAGATYGGDNTAGYSSSRLATRSQLSVAPNGTVYFLDTNGSGRVRSYNGTALADVFGNGGYSGPNVGATAGTSRLADARSIEVSSTGRIYVSDAGFGSFITIG